MAELSERSIGLMVIGVELAEFFLLALLGFLFMQLMHWEAQLSQRRGIWLRQLRQSVRQLKVTRRQMERSGGNWPKVSFGRRFDRLIKVVGWAGLAFGLTRRSRS